MRASFLLVLAVALLVGLGVAVFIKNTGLFNPPPLQLANVPPPPQPQILVAARGLFAGDALLPTDVRLRPATDAELKAVKEAPDKYLPAVPDVAYFRYVARNVEPDRPLMREDLEAMKKPESLADRLPAGTTAVAVSVPKDRSAGGLIQLGDWVDVYLTTQVGRTDQPVASPRTALIAKGGLVVVKRNTLYPVYAPLPDDQPVHFTLALNPYRAALVEHAMTVGSLLLVPANETEKAALNKIKEQVGSDPEQALRFGAPNPNSSTFMEELRRVSDYKQGKMVIGPDQLMEAFGLAPLQAKPQPIKVQVFHGTQLANVATFQTPASDPPAVPQYQFGPVPGLAADGLKAKAESAPKPAEQRQPASVPPRVAPSLPGGIGPRTTPLSPVPPVQPGSPERTTPPGGSPGR